MPINAHLDVKVGRRRRSRRRKIEGEITETEEIENISSGQGNAKKQDCGHNPFFFFARKEETNQNYTYGYNCYDQPMQLYFIILLSSILHIGR